MERRLFGIVLVATVVLAQEDIEESLSQGYIPQHGHAFSYSHVFNDHGHALTNPVQPQYYPVYQPLTFTVPVAVPVSPTYKTPVVEKYTPYGVNVPVAGQSHRTPVDVDRPAARPYQYPVKYPVAAAVPSLVPVVVPKPYPALAQGPKPYSALPQGHKPYAALGQSPKPHPVLAQGHQDYREEDGSFEYSSIEDDESR